MGQKLIVHVLKLIVMQSSIMITKRNAFFFISFFLIQISYAQHDSLKFNRKESIRLDSLGMELQKEEKYIEAIEYYDKALEKDSTNGEAILHRAIAISNSGIKSCNKINICDEIQRAYDYGAKHVEESAFFYGCKIRKRK